MDLRFLLIASVVGVCACSRDAREEGAGNSGTPAGAVFGGQEASNDIIVVEEQGDSDSSASVGDRISEIQGKLDSQRQIAEGLEAFLQMERAKLEEDPEYDQSFLIEALEEHQQIQNSIRSGEARLGELRREGE